jgi:HlyD family secretion protein
MAKKKSNKLLYILLAIVVILVLFSVIGKSMGWIGKPTAITVETATVKKSTIIEKVSASGDVQPQVEVTISPDVPGEIIELNVKEGEARFVQVKADFERNKQLLEEKVISQSDFETAQANYQTSVQELESAKQNVQAGIYRLESARASVKEAEENLSLTNVYAPMGGTISKLSVEQGERVVGTSQMAGTEMMRIADLNRMEARVNVNENDIIRVAIGDTAIIDVDAYSYLKKKFTGVVTEIANTANTKASQDAVTEFQVRIRILNDSYKDLIKEGQKSSAPFRPGMTASVEIITNKKSNVLSVPLAAVTTRNPAQASTSPNSTESSSADEAGTEVSTADQSTTARDGEMKEVVFVKEGDIAKLVEVETGISDYQNIEIVSGLEEGTEVVSGPFSVVSKRLKDGDVIEKAGK